MVCRLMVSASVIHVIYIKLHLHCSFTDSTEMEGWVVNWNWYWKHLQNKRSMLDLKTLMLRLVESDRLHVRPVEKNLIWWHTKSGWLLRNNRLLCHHKLRPSVGTMLKTCWVVQQEAVQIEKNHWHQQIIHVVLLLLLLSLFYNYFVF